MTHTAEYPEQIIRVNFPFEDVIVVSGHWTEWDEATRREFADLIASTRPSDVVPVVAQFVASHDPADLVASDQVEDDEPDPPHDPPVADAQSDPVVDLEVPPDAPTPVVTSAKEDPATTEHHIHQALKTAVTAKAWAETHPEDIPAMIAHEEGDAGKARKSVLAELRALTKNAGE